MKRNILFLFSVVFCMAVFSSCRSNMGNTGRMQIFPVMSSESSWIRNGEPIEFEGEKWYPSDVIESLLDSEVLVMGQFRSVQFFIEKADVRPYNGLYTKFDANKFRFFEKKLDSDK